MNIVENLESLLASSGGAIAKCVGRNEDDEVVMVWAVARGKTAAKLLGLVEEMEEFSDEDGEVLP